MPNCREVTGAACYTMLVCVLSFTGISASLAEGSISEGLKACSLIESTAERLACYDELSNRAELPETASAAASNPSFDTLGAETLSNYDRDSADSLAVSARVTGCKRDAHKKLLFYFENGHVWKQVGSRRLRYKDCDFDVVITKDGFGYKMQQVGEGRRVRISRIR